MTALPSKMCHVTYVDEKLYKIALKIILGMKSTVLMNLGIHFGHFDNAFSPAENNEIIYKISRIMFISKS